MKKTPALGDSAGTKQLNPIAPHRRRGKQTPTALFVIDTADKS
jgi:hypothetical protein